MTEHPCTLEILLTDRDFEVARHMLDHQLGAVARSCKEVILTLNRFPEPTGPVEPTDQLLARICDRFPNVRVVEVDASAEMQRSVSEAFFDGRPYPLFDFKGTPIHAILAQLLRATQPYYLHLESDMLLAGDFDSWLAAGLTVLESDPTVLAINPLGGPLRADGVYSTPNAPRRDVSGNPGYVIRTMNTRVFLIEREAFIEKIRPIPLHGPRALRSRISRTIRGAMGEELLERLISERMAELAMVRFDLGGPSSDPACTIHPLHKTPTYVNGLPDIIDRVERGDIPAEQRGEFDVHRSMIDLPDIPSLASRGRKLLVAGAKNWPERLRGNLGHRG